MSKCAISNSGPTIVWIVFWSLMAHFLEVRHCCHAPLQGTTCAIAVDFFILLFFISTKYITYNTDINSTTYKQQIYRIQQKISLRIQFIILDFEHYKSRVATLSSHYKSLNNHDIEVEGGGHDEHYKSRVASLSSHYKSISKQP